MRTVVVTRAVRMLLVSAVLVLALAACSSDGSDGGDSSTEQLSTASTGASLDDLPTFDTLDDLVAALDDAGFACVLDYEGLEDADKVLSLCTIEGGQAQLTIWKDPSYVEAFVGSGGATDLTVYGANWTIDLRDADTALAVADALRARTGG